jgi:hypothetical protein
MIKDVFPPCETIHSMLPAIGVLAEVEGKYKTRLLPRCVDAWERMVSLKT